MSSPLGAPSFMWPWSLSQPINPGWSFGNVIVNTSNSSAPDVEQNVVSHHSYGRQIGKLMDAVCALADALPKTATDERIVAFRELAQDVARIKAEAATSRIDQLRGELAELRQSDPQAFNELVATVKIVRK
ncbi:hypothetical protein BH09PSE5_BH09PSE5_29380 [soil metagenome]